MEDLSPFIHVVTVRNGKYLPVILILTLYIFVIEPISSHIKLGLERVNISYEKNEQLLFKVS